MYEKDISSVYAEKTRKAIKDYKSYRPNTLGFFSRYFDFTRGERRADMYLKMLDYPTIDKFKRLIIIYALLCGGGKFLRKKVVESLGFNNNEVARTSLKNQIENMQSSVSYNYKKLAQRISNYADSDKTYDPKDFLENFNEFKNSTPIDSDKAKKFIDSNENLIEKFEKIQEIIIANKAAVDSNIPYMDVEIKYNKQGQPYLQSVMQLCHGRDQKKADSSFFNWLLSQFGIKGEFKVGARSTFSFTITSIPDNAVSEMEKRYPSSKIFNI